MRSGAWLSWLWVCTSCTAPNPAYEGTDAGLGDETTGETQGSTTGRTTTGSAEESTSNGDGASAADPDTSAGISASTSASSSSGEDPRVFDECRAQLYGVSQAGGLFLIDLEAQEAMQVGEAPDSIAVATHPVSGEIYISALRQSDQLYRIDPSDFTALPPMALPHGESFPAMGASWPVFSRAAFDAQANLWLGGYTSGHFVRYRPGDAASTVWFIGDVPTGGDMILIAEAEALVITNDPPARQVSFGMGMTMSTMVDVQGVPAGMALTGLALVGADPWTSAGITLESTDSMIHRLDATGTDAYQVAEGFYLDVRIDDLAPVVTHPDGC